MSIKEIKEEEGGIVCIPDKDGEELYLYSILPEEFLSENGLLDVAVVGRNMSTTVELKTLSDLLNSLPDFLQHKIITQNKHHIALSNSSQVRVTTGSSQFFQGQTHNLIIMDNYRYNDDTTDFINQIIKPIMSCRSDSQIINIQSG
jgi:hypothetical protein